MINIQESNYFLPVSQHQIHVSGKHLLQLQQDAEKKKKCVFEIMENNFTTWYKNRDCLSIVHLSALILH